MQTKYHLCILETLSMHTRSVVKWHYTAKSSAKNCVVDVISLCHTHLQFS